MNFLMKQLRVETCLKEIKMLEPGCVLVVRGGAASVERYFAIEARPHEEDAPHTVSHERTIFYVSSETSGSDAVIQQNRPLKKTTKNTVAYATKYLKEVLKNE